ncbi:MAG TPA: hypothetical protein DCZ95_00905 [Verrucomicrobia bacterium]|nr:hypothetical protein [Verrucomicrobiota bacterium]
MKNIWKLLILLLAAAPIVTGCSTLSQPDAMQPSALGDQQITDDVIRRLQDDTVTGQTTFNVEVQNGVATVRGVIRNESVRGRALGIARGAPGVVDVVDGITLR